jgi:nicotinate-nucleotide--dimethylbenzimidazole phosphoribosyltransferase
MENIVSLVSSIQPLNHEKMEETQRHLDQLTKPPGSLGRLEALALQIAGIREDHAPVLSKKAVIVMAADHGVCEEGISAYPSEVTGQMVLNFCNGGAAVNVMARHASADVICVDIGVKETIEHEGLVVSKVKRGTANIAHGPAMSEDEALKAIWVGVDLVEKLVKEGYQLIATGEMGIGNTTASSAILSALTDVSVEDAVGRGTGIDDARWKHKQEVVKRSIAVNQPDSERPIEVLYKLGGLEIAGLVGVILGAAKYRVPVVIDGFISSAAALIASRIAPSALHYMISSHLSHEQGHKLMLEAIGLQPMMQMEMRLGEGTGAVLSFPVIDVALKLLREMATFSSAGVSNK